MAALIIGTLLALAALAYVLYPLFVEPTTAAARARHGRAEPSARDEAVAALREVEFDRETGKLSDADYAVLKGRYTEEALAAMRAEAPELSLTTSRGSASTAAGSPGADTPTFTRSVSDDAIEAEIRRARERVPSCAACGPRPEPDATYCSTCGRYLPGRCDGCRAQAEEPGARYCASCGHTLAA